MKGKKENASKSFLSSFKETVRRNGRSVSSKIPQFINFVAERQEAQRLAIVMAFIALIVILQQIL